MTAALEQLIAAKRDFGMAVCRRMADNIAKLGFTPASQIATPDFDAAEFSLVTDPFTQSQDLVGYWYNGGKQRVGQIKFHGDGSFYAEYDVVRPHPGKKQYFVEAINAWGQQDNIKTEAKLLDIPE
ncbi:hypothetical protein NP590_00175 [Methylomonas sp. SURF-2]|uniref:Uncharacterized protein n=1 Tax=Methylomonas subterranea TaxID=2952225 RepID=A0ABT1TAK7_9GAMM|nr:hypothetical protein [Methylomonas sp. SURF-2]MCQ8102502.1 hypothetical protein [Methylomonas sp. SURF-2]